MRLSTFILLSLGIFFNLVCYSMNTNIQVGMKGKLMHQNKELNFKVTEISSKTKWTHKIKYEINRNSLYEKVFLDLDNWIYEASQPLTAYTEEKTGKITEFDGKKSPEKRQGKFDGKKSPEKRQGKKRNSPSKKELQASRLQQLWFEKGTELLNKHKTYLKRKRNENQEKPVVDNVKMEINDAVPYAQYTILSENYVDLEDDSKNDVAENLNTDFLHDEDERYINLGKDLRNNPTANYSLYDKVEDFDMMSSDEDDRIRISRMPSLSESDKAQSNISNPNFANKDIENSESGSKTDDDLITPDILNRILGSTEEDSDQSQLSNDAEDIFALVEAENTEEELPLTRNSDTITIGAKVCVYGLQTNTWKKLNGCIGQVNKQIKVDIWGVRLLNGQKYRFKTENLRLHNLEMLSNKSRRDAYFRENKINYGPEEYTVESECFIDGNEKQIQYFLGLQNMNYHQIKTQYETEYDQIQEGMVGRLWYKNKEETIDLDFIVQYIDDDENSDRRYLIKYPNEFEFLPEWVDLNLKTEMYTSDEKNKNGEIIPVEERFAMINYRERGILDFFNFAEAKCFDEQLIANNEMGHNYFLALIGEEYESLVKYLSIKMQKEYDQNRINQQEIEIMIEAGLEIAREKENKIIENLLIKFKNNL